MNSGHDTGNLELRAPREITMSLATLASYDRVIDEICGLRWNELTAEELTDVAWAYYYFSIQFREHLKIARAIYPFDQKLQQLEKEECNTDNLSPWPGVASAHEQMDHDEFIRRLLTLSPIDKARRSRLAEIGEAYLVETRGVDRQTRAASIASYEDGGLERVFRAILTSPDWDGPLLGAFSHFLSEHIRFDSDPEQGHGALSRHIMVDDRVSVVWTEFKHLLTRSVPKLALPAA